MNKKKTAILLLSLCLSFVICSAETGVVAAQLRQNQLHSYLKQGIEKVFNLEPQNASIHLQKAVDPLSLLFLNNPKHSMFPALRRATVFARWPNGLR